VASSRQDREARQARERLRAYEARQEVHRRQGGRRRRDNIIAIVGVVVVAALATLTQIYYFSAGPGKAAASATPTSSASATPSASASAAGSNLGAPDKSLAADREWTGTLTLNAVKMDISLDGKKAPQGVSGFIRDVQDDYFDGKTCHRLAQSEGFGIIQCGSVDGAGGSDSGYHFGPVENAPADNIYPAGTIAMARAGGDAYSNGHQFFIAFDQSTIPSDAAGGYTVIGKVTSGLDELKSTIVAGGITPGASGDTDGAPKIATTITSVTLK
jgi:peptidyl-prolyl cis-trans isomerase B (cyclophilin B)